MSLPPDIPSEVPRIDKYDENGGSEGGYQSVAGPCAAVSMGYLLTKGNVSFALAFRFEHNFGNYATNVFDFRISHSFGTRKKDND